MVDAANRRLLRAVVTSNSHSFSQPENSQAGIKIESLHGAEFRIREALYLDDVFRRGYMYV